MVRALVMRSMFPLRLWPRALVRCRSAPTSRVHRAALDKTSVFCDPIPPRQRRCFCQSVSKWNDASELRLYDRIQSRVALNEFRSDEAQLRLARRLDRLQEALVGYDNKLLLDYHDQLDKFNMETCDKPENELKKSEEKPSTPSLRIPRGLYVHGPVGTGKTMVMDLFYQTLSVPTHKKARYHFHSFLAQVHAQIHHQKQIDLQTNGRNFSIELSTSANPIKRVAHRLASSWSVLCLDEFQVTDIADAVILSQLFGELFRKGTVVVATSNRPPIDLYEGGLNRSYFLPFLDILQKHCIVHEISSSVDYRTLLSSCASFFLTPSSSETVESVLEDILDTLELTSTPCSVELEVGFQRRFLVRRAYEPPLWSKDPPLSRRAVAVMEFGELCDRDLGSSDYRALAQRFDIVILQNVPTLNLEGHNRARRFITLVDELYEGKCCVLCSTVSAETPTELFEMKVQNRQIDATKENLATVMGIDVASQGGTAVGALASVRELSFAFERASSRVVEMCSRSWWEEKVYTRTK